jgi:hypothetical protein
MLSRSTAWSTRAVKLDGTGASGKRASTSLKRDSISKSACISGCAFSPAHSASVSFRRQSRSRNEFWSGSFFIVLSWLKTTAQTKLHVKFAGIALFKTPAMCYSNATKKT